MTIEEFLKILATEAKEFEWEISGRIIGRITGLDFAFTPLSTVATRVAPSKTTRLWHENKLAVRDLSFSVNDARIILSALDEEGTRAGTQANKLRNQIIYILLSHTVSTMNWAKK